MEAERKEEHEERRGKTLEMSASDASQTGTPKSAPELDSGREGTVVVGCSTGQGCSITSLIMTSFWTMTSICCSRTGTNASGARRK